MRGEEVSGELTYVQEVDELAEDEGLGAVVRKLHEVEFLSKVREGRGQRRGSRLA